MQVTIKLFGKQTISNFNQWLCTIIQFIIMHYICIMYTVKNEMIQ